MSTSTGTETTPHEIAEEGSNALLYGLGAAMIVVVLLACVLIEEATLGWLLAAFGGLVVVLCGVAVFIFRFIGPEDEH